MMKRKFVFGLGIAAAIATAPLAMSTPVFANLQQAGSAIAQKLMRPDVKLEMGVDKQITVTDADGKEVQEWQSLEGEATVQPGDVLRYAVDSSNAGEIAAEKLVIEQPIPAQMTYVIGSQKGNSAATPTYSIDNGETFVDEPMVEVVIDEAGNTEMRPAPAEAYTHVKWTFSDALGAEEAVSVSHAVIVK